MFAALLSTLKKQVFGLVSSFVLGKIQPILNRAYALLMGWMKKKQVEQQGDKIKEAKNEKDFNSSVDDLD